MAREHAMNEGTLIAIPDDILKDDLLESYWFVDHEGYLIIEIPHTGETGKAIAFFYPITQKIESKTLTTEKQRREVLVFPKFQLERNYYRYWPGVADEETFILNEEMHKVMEKNAKKSLTILKSKCLCFLFTCVVDAMNKVMEHHFLDAAPTSKTSKKRSHSAEDQEEAKEDGDGSGAEEEGTSQSSSESTGPTGTIFLSKQVSNNNLISFLRHLSNPSPYFALKNCF